MISRFKRSAMTALLLGAVLALTGIFSVTAQDSSSFRVGTNAPVTLDPHTNTNDPEIMFNRMIYDYLMDIAPDGSLMPQLATDYTVSDDGLTYTLNLVENATFHDGSDFTAADVVYTFERMAEVGSPAMNLLGTLESGEPAYTVSAVDDYTVEFVLTQPNADFAFGLASRWSLIVSEGAENVNTVGEDLSNFNGTGAFILTEYLPGERATFTANENYWAEGQPQVSSVEMIFIEEIQAQIDALRTGTVDFIFKIPFDRIDELEGEGLNVAVKATNQHPVIRIRADEGALGEDPLVREAFKYATDRELLNINLFDGRAAVGNNDPIGPLYGPFYDDTIENQGFDPARSCELLNEAGYPDGLGADEPIPFYVVDSFNYVQMAEFLQQDWAEGCINIEILPRSEGEYYAGDADTAEWLNVDLGVTGWGSRPIPQQYFVEAYVTGASFNEAHWSDAELDELVAQAAVTADIAERSAIYSQIAQIFRDRGPIIVPFFAPVVGVIADGVEGVDMHPFPGRTDFRNVVVGG